jgi:GT2 family glycosyltransferase
MQKRVEIILLKYKNLEVEIPSLVSILKGTEWPYILTVYDNRNGTKNMAKLWNELIGNSQQDFIAIIDSDTKVKPFWLTKMMEVMRSFPKCGVVVPRTNHCSEGLQVRVDPERAPLRIDHGLVSGFCFLLRRGSFKEMTGGFDEEFGFYGQDSEFFVRMAKQSRWEVYLQPQAYVFHYGQHSVKNKTEDEDYDFAADKRRALELYYQKTAGY